MAPSPTLSPRLSPYGPALLWALGTWILLSLPVPEDSLQKLSWLQGWVEAHWASPWRDLALWLLAVSDGWGDKLVHCGLFAVQGALLLKGYEASSTAIPEEQVEPRGIGLRISPWLWATFWGSLFGGLTELWQGWGPPQRDASLGDWLADGLGALAGAWLMSRLVLRQRETRGREIGAARAPIAEAPGSPAAVD
ncbi:MAG: hypothetical protein AAGD01_06530 [Acidobacteriota bacterium]